MGASYTLSTVYKAIDGTSGPLKAMEKANARFAAGQDKALKALGTSFANVRNNLLALGGNISAAALLMTGFNAIKDFDESLASLRAITGLTGEAFVPFKAQIMKIGDGLNIAYPTIAKTMELMGSLDSTLLDSADDMAAMTKAAVLLSKASGAELSTTAQSLTAILKMFGGTAKDAARYVDILSTSEQKGTYTVGELASGLKTAGGTARSLGMNVDQTAALLQALAPSSKSVEVASTALDAILNKLGTTTNKNFNPAIVGSAKAIQNLKDANLDLKQAQGLVGADRAGELLSLINQNDIVQKLSDNQYVLGNAKKQAAERALSFVERVNQLTGKFKNIMISANETSSTLNFFGKVLGVITNNLGLILGIIGTSIGVYGGYLVIMNLIRISTLAWNIVTGINLALQGSYPIAMAANTVALTAFNVATKIAAAVQWLFNTSLLGCPIIWIILGIAALVAGIILLVKNWDKVSAAMGAFFKMAWDGIKKFARYILEYMLFPVTMVLKAIAKLTGAKWANDALAGIEKIKDFVSDDNDPAEAKNTKPVNTIATSNQVQTQRYEENKQNQISLLLQNKTDKKVNVTQNWGVMPVNYSTY